ncbi:MAG: hypothetical protein JXP34_03455, partial [Planctomycetes bacterium]|nr:hypothetical protein [Planctomycetota bacterium]
LRNATRRRGRSMATVALLACGAFLVIAVGANRRDPLAGAGERASGTGGFASIGESALPIARDPDDPDVRRDRDIESLDPERIRIVAMRVREGDDASCLNMNRPQQPRIIGVPVEELAARGAFRFARVLEGRGSERPWDLLDAKLEDGAVPAIADHNTIIWSLGSAVGETLRLTGERGETFTVRFVASLAPSILQGGILIGEAPFIRHFPSSGGARLFLVDAPAGEAGPAAEALVRAYGREGLALEPAAERLAAYYALEDTYLTIFQLLGGLGMLIGSIGLGLVVLRNLLERRGELALLRAVGFAPRRLRRLVLWEHGGLLALGLACGAAAAAVAVLPALRAAGAAVPLVSLGLTLAGILANGFLWAWLAAALALRGRLLDALRDE